MNTENHLATSDRKSTDYPIPEVRIKVDAPQRGLRIMSEHDVADELARQDKVQPVEPSEPTHESVAATPIPSNGAALLEVAREVHAARAELERIDGRLAELHEKSRDLDALKATLAEARDRRAQRLADRMIAGHKVNSTDKIDRDVAAAQEALQLREDEITAVERALVVLDAQREGAETALNEAYERFKERHGERTREIEHIRWLAEKLCDSIASARACVAEMPEQFLCYVKLELPEPGVPEIQKAITQAEAKLGEAAALAAPPPEPTKPRGWTWSDGTVRDDPEPGNPASRAVEPGTPLCVWKSDGTVHLEPEPQPGQATHTYRPGVVDQSTGRA